MESNRKIDQEKFFLIAKEPDSKKGGEIAKRFLDFY